MRKILSCTAVGTFVFGLALAACGGGGGGGSTSAFCDTVKKDKQVFDKLDASSDISSDASNSAALAAFNDLVKKSPSEIKSDMQTIQHTLESADQFSKEIGKAFSDGDFEKASSIGQSFSDANKGTEQASKNVTKFVKDKCGIDLESDSSSSSSSSKRSSSSSSRSSSTGLGSDFSFSFDSDSLSSLLSDLSSLSDFSFSS